MADSRLRTAWAVRAAAGEPFAVVRVKNLQTVIRAGTDAWGRPNDAGQPVLVSAEVSFGNNFSTAASQDELGLDTVHYGNLSKAILSVLNAYIPASIAAPSAPVRAGDNDSYAPLSSIMDRIWTRLTGTNLNGSSGASAAPGSPPFLDLSRVRFLSITLRLPKALLLGDGVTLAACSLFETHEGRSWTAMFSRTLRLHDLRVPTLIGLNAIERKAKQFAVTTVEVDKVDFEADFYTLLEDLIVKVSLSCVLPSSVDQPGDSISIQEMESSAFKTLEALGARLSEAIRTSNWLAPQEVASPDISQWQIRISMEKPTAVPLADSPVVELVIGPR